MKKKKRTYAEAYKKVAANTRQMKSKKGKYYERWKAGMKTWVERL